MSFKELDLKKTLYSIGDFLEWGNAGLLDINPPFQRRSVWKKPAKSLLIDTILRGLPIPIIFLRESTDIEKLRTVRQVVDGQQRIRTIFSFIDPKILHDFDQEQDEFVIQKSHNKDLADKGFNDLSKELRQRIIDYQFSVHTLPSMTTDRDVLEIFRRLNSTGTPLNNQELINAEFSGEFTTYVSNASLQQLERWVDWVFTESEVSRMKEIELTTDLFILMLDGISGRSKTIFREYYGDYDDEFEFGELLTSRFQDVFEAIENTIGDKIDEMFIVKKTLFYGIFAIFYDKMFGLNSGFRRVRAKKLPANFKQKLLRLDSDVYNNNAPKGVIEIVSRNTTHAVNRDILVNYFISRM